MENLFYKWKQLGAGVFHIQDLFSDYMYLVAGEEKAALIDTGTGIGSRAFRRDYAGVGLQPAEKTVGIRKSGKIGKQCVECKGTEKTRTYGFTCTDQSGRQGVGSVSHPGTYEGLCLLLRQKK